MKKFKTYLYSLALAVMLATPTLVQPTLAQRAIRQFQLQDDESGSQFTFDTTGNYVYAGCRDGLKLEGVGNLKISGCTITLEAVSRFSLVQAEVNLCKSAGQASILLEGPCPVNQNCEPQHLTVVDSDTNNNTPDCK